MSEQVERELGGSVDRFKAMQSAAKKTSRQIKDEKGLPQEKESE